MTGIPVTSFKPPPPWVAKSNPNDPWPWPDGLTVLAQFTDYAGMLQAFRDRANERKISMSDEDTATIAGLPDKYLAKLLAPRPVRRIGMLSLGPVLGVLGAKLLLVVDEEACRRLESRKDVRLKQRNGNLVRGGGGIEIRHSYRFMQKIGRKGAKVRWARVRKRRALASKAARARWGTKPKSAKSDARSIRRRATDRGANKLRSVAPRSAVLASLPRSIALDVATPLASPPSVSTPE